MFLEKLFHYKPTLIGFAGKDKFLTSIYINYILSQQYIYNRVTHNYKMH